MDPPELPPVPGAVDAMPAVPPGLPLGLPVPTVEPAVPVEDPASPIPFVWVDASPVTLWLDPQAQASSNGATTCHRIPIPPSVVVS
jgi:hypothetical protein